MNSSPLTLEADIANKFPDDNLELPSVNPPILPAVAVISSVTIVPDIDTADAVI